MKPSAPVPGPLPKAPLITDLACVLLALVLSFPCMDMHYNRGGVSLWHPLQGSHLLLGVAVFTHPRASTTWPQADPFIPGTSVCVPRPLPACPSPPPPRGCSRCHCRYSQRDGRSGGLQFLDISNDAAISQTSVGFSFPGYDPMARPNPAQTYSLQPCLKCLPSPTCSHLVLSDFLISPNPMGSLWGFNFHFPAAESLDTLTWGCCPSWCPLMSTVCPCPLLFFYCKVCLFLMNL